MEKHYDVIIVGAGPAGIFTAYELTREHPELNILMLEKGRDIYKRKCPKHTNGGICVHCKPCSITTGWAGAGAFSDGKLSLSHEVGGTLPDYIGVEAAMEMIRYTDDIYLKFGADTGIHGLNETLTMREIRRKSIEANLKLVQCPVRHLGTEKTQELYRMLFEHLKNRGVEVRFNSPVTDFIIEDHIVKGVLTAGKSFLGQRVVVAVGRDGSEWLMKQCSVQSIPMEVGIVDIGVRLECRNEVMQEINENFYEAKLIHYTRTFDDKVRTFCSNPGGFVSSEYYDNNLAVVNGHSYKDLKSDNTNFALLVSQKFTEPFNAPIEYGRHIARLANMLTRNKIMVQRFGDLVRGRRTTSDRLYRNNIVPTLKDAVPGDLSLVLPHRILFDIIEMIKSLDKVSPGLASDETLLYGVEVKFYSNIVKVDSSFQSTTVKNLYFGGDGAGITRGLMQASVNGVLIARDILNNITTQS
ncbi:MAG TPA: FAD-dependent oxidoreductase [Prolixibacteraceae bacterium]|nr:FAD-dependent oxidoreductase [Prolixibacteraceae bacterium]